jgi:hypothetical protein
VPCFQLRAFLTAPEVRRILDLHFIVLELTVWEQPGRTHLNNHGAEAMMTEFGAGRGGIPFFVVLDASRQVLATSESGGLTGGFPASPKEIAAFVELLSRAAPRMSAAERATLGQWLRDRAEGGGAIYAESRLGEVGNPGSGQPSTAGHHVS